MKTFACFVLPFAVASAEFSGERQQNLPSSISLSAVDTLAVSGVKSATLETATLVNKNGTELYVRVSSFPRVMTR